MKKQVLSALAFCSALGIAQAQTDVTKEYLVNPSFETLKAADGATEVAVKTKLENGLLGWEGLGDVYKRQVPPRTFWVKIPP